MNLPFNIISIETLMDKWNMSKMDVFQIVLNHNLIPVHKGHPESDWKEYDFQMVIYLFTWPEKYGDRQIIFRVSDIENLERKLGSKLSIPDSIISGEELCKRWNVSMVEIEDLIEVSNLEVVDPIGKTIRDFRELSLGKLYLTPWMFTDGMTRYFRKTDVEGLEKANNINPNEGQICGADKIGNPKTLDGDTSINYKKCLDVLHEKYSIENNTEKRLELKFYIKVVEEFLKKDLADS